MRLYLVTDSALAAPRALIDVVAAAVRGGVTAVQLREKDCCTREFVELARALKAAVTVPLIVNDRVDVALAADADGVHVGQSDMDCRDVRRILGSSAIVGLSVEKPEQAAADLPVDYFGVGPIFATPTKSDAASAWGLEPLAALRARTRRQLIAIGGIHAGNAHQVMEAGADGIAVVSAI
ncbi:MAG TPA: thiamine phosphate synthase, partial [Bryobacteraceae bacterium]|nr:thiamine phosphate synthase [Bryobacteraceae bacterium]